MDKRIQVNEIYQKKYLPCNGLKLFRYLLLNNILPTKEYIIEKLKNGLETESLTR